MNIILPSFMSIYLFFPQKQDPTLKTAGFSPFMTSGRRRSAKVARSRHYRRLCQPDDFSHPNQQKQGIHRNSWNATHTRYSKKCINIYIYYIYLTYPMMQSKLSIKRSGKKNRFCVCVCFSCDFYVCTGHFSCISPSSTALP